jgi:uncharacterized protein YbjT (DUF2867 family)
MYVVAGVTGQTGAAAAEELLRRGEPVRVLVRDASKGARWKEKGAEVAVADLSDSAALGRALAGAEGAYFLIPPQYGADDLLAAQKPVVEAVARAIRESRIPHVVLLSSIGAQQPQGTGPVVTLHRAEKALREAARNLTILRAGYFLENWAPVLGEAREKSVLPTFLTPGRPVPMVATADIGRVAAEALLDPPSDSSVRIIELAGPRDLTPEDVAAALSRKLGREVKILPLPSEAAVGALQAAGFPPGVARLFAEMYGAVNSGHMDWQRAGTVSSRGRLGPEDVLGPMLA